MTNASATAYTIARGGDGDDMLTGGTAGADPTGGISGGTAVSKLYGDAGDDVITGGAAGGADPGAVTTYIYGVRRACSGVSRHRHGQR